MELETLRDVMELGALLAFVSSHTSTLVYAVRHFLSDLVAADHNSARRRNL